MSLSIPEVYSVLFRPVGTAKHCIDSGETQKSSSLRFRFVRSPEIQPNAFISKNQLSRGIYCYLF